MGQPRHGQHKLTKWLESTKRYALFSGQLVCFQGSELSEKPDLLREMLCAIPPFLGERIRCLAPILGESHDSGHSPGLDATAKRQEIPERFMDDSRGMFQIAEQGSFRANLDESPRYLSLNPSTCGPLAQKWW